MNVTILSEAVMEKLLWIAQNRGCSWEEVLDTVLEYSLALHDDALNEKKQQSNTKIKTDSLEIPLELQKMLDESA